MRKILHRGNGAKKQFDKEKVLDKAMKLFWKKGYNATSMEDLVSTLGINRARM